MIRVGILPYYEEAFPNPYQWQFVKALEDAGLEVVKYTSRRFVPAARIRADAIDIVHFDWPHGYFVGGSVLKGLVKRVAFRRSLGTLGKAKVVWTVHNLASHDGGNATERRMTQCLVDHCGGLMVHSQAAETLLRQTYRVGDGLPVRRIPHGHYVDAYKNDISRDDARRQLKLAEASRVVLFFGNLLPYKGIDRLIVSFSDIAKPGEALQIVGTSCDEAYTEKLRKLTARATSAGVDVRLEPRPLQEDEIQVYHNAADLVALPFKNILNSGTLLLGMSFGRCILAPRMGSVPEVTCPEAYFGYEPGQPDTLKDALRTALDHDDLPQRGQQALAHVKEHYAWGPIGQQVRQLYQEVLGGPEA